MSFSIAVTIPKLWHLAVAILVASSLLLLTYRTWSAFINQRRAANLGCKAAYVRPYRWPLGLDILKRYIDASNNSVLQNDDLALFEELGCRPTWYQNVLGTWHYYTTDPKNIQAILATQFKDFELGPLRRGVLGPIVGNGIFTHDGHDWERSRVLLRPQFSRSQVADLELEERHVQHLLQRLPVCLQGWTAKVDLAPLFFNLTLDSATEFLLGESVDSQLESLHVGGKTGSHRRDWSAFGHAFDRANQESVTRARLMELYFLYSPPSFRRDCKTIHRFVDEYVDGALREVQSSNVLDFGGESKACRYIFLHELAKATQDRTELRSQVLNILIAGRDTTAGLLGWTFYLLARHPTVFTRLRGEILQAFGTSDTSLTTFESLKSCTYLKHTMNEVLRLHPLVPENSRRAVRNTTLPRGGGLDGASPIYVRAGEEVAYNVHVMHRRKDLWGADANEFRPERWQGLRPGWEYIPFNGGPRVCLGQQFALTEAGYVIVRLLQRFDKLENLDLSPITRHRYTNTTSPVQCLVRLHKAHD
jgi:cytochrome P450